MRRCEETQYVQRGIGLIFIVVFGAFLAGMRGERWLATRARKAWWSRRKKSSGATVVALERPSPGAITDASDQLRLVMNSSFEKRRLLSKSEARVFYAAEKAVKDQRLAWRVMAQVSLGEILSSPDPKAYGAINSKRVDVLLISSAGEPIAAIEYQGSGHYQGTAPARDAVKKEALRRAGVGYIEITPDHGGEDVAREIARVAGREAQAGAASPTPGG